MRIQIDVPEYDMEKGIRLEWKSSFTIVVQDEDGSIMIQANCAGLESLACHLLTLSQADVPIGCHIHYDETNSLEKGSCELIIEKIE